MNERIRLLAEQAGETMRIVVVDYGGGRIDNSFVMEFNKEKFAQLVAAECAEICMEMWAKCAGLPGEGAVAKDCADYIKKDFGVKL